MIDQNDKDESERRLLEQELASELDELTADDVWLDDGNFNDTIVDDKFDHNETISTSWKLLLESLERNDCEFYKPCHENLHELRASYLDATIDEKTQHEQKVNERDTDRLVVQTRCNAPAVPHQTINEIESHDTLRSEIDVLKKERDDDLQVTSNAICENLTHFVSDEPVRISPRSILDSDQDLQTLPTDISSLAISEEERNALDQVKQAKLKAIAMQHEIRITRRLTAQARVETEHAETAKLLLCFEEEFQSQEKNAAMLRQEAHERSQLALEEIRCRRVAAAEREVEERVLMTLADKDSQRFAFEIVCVRREECLMKAEDQAEKHRIWISQQRQKIVAQNCFALVLIALVNFHTRRQKAREQENKRELRECVEMRAEEARARRVSVEKRLLYEQQERDRNRIGMTAEDLLSKDIETCIRYEEEERCRQLTRCKSMQMEEIQSRAGWAFIAHLRLQQQQNENHARFFMNQEELRTRIAWNYQIEAKRQECERSLLAISSALQRLGRVLKRHQVEAFYTEWKMWLEHEITWNRVRMEVAEKAAEKIQTWYQLYRCKGQENMAVLCLEEEIDNEPHVACEDDEEEIVEQKVYETAEAHGAALCVQSAFRGFHVRRKYAHALALAIDFGTNDDELVMDGVDIENFLQLPPELTDGWEDPVLPVIIQEQYSSKTKHFDGNCSHDIDNKVRLLPRSDVDIPLKEPHLAATLWNKMKRVKQYQQQSRLERQRQRDPIYRVSKLLQRKPPTSSSVQNGNNQSSSSAKEVQKTTNFISWSVTTSSKKKPKVKLPSLVERLRKQTMAER
ncbi:IQ motif, EF-hand binding site [Plasmopara halstedii]|uniref:IQ motif, EF-hand binding site n=1 Tax=Plasmopara halstedii TaxID=4781 RepID=A0A0P1A981_PLAHL|nr:IQ motif, EF-hand binding site [Plasmopara halstedii]CEG36997.1 IQ motif, EF-hand binding site [Plasmopara halstedii]|eukprot:XP_024573366.1 IQ motif, EF-hand binding site [Plasmopara halstedii]